MSQTYFENLLPRPRHVERGCGVLSLAEAGTYTLSGGAAQIDAAHRVLQKSLGPAWQLETGSAQAQITFRIVPVVAGAQSYRLQITDQTICAEAQDRAGLFYAATTLAQIICLGARVVPGCLILDAPDFEVRGVLLDVSRDKVPTQETLFGLIDCLTALKVNQLQLYTEHAFAYCGHEEVWREATPLTPAEIRTLDVYCRERCMELVPNQNSFGHLERWLSHARYSHLAELPQGGAPLPWGGTRAYPAALCPTDANSLLFLEELYDQLLPNFSSTLFNVGCDEVFDLRGEGRSAEYVRKQGEGRIYLDFLKKVHTLVTARGRRMAFWGDIIIHHPELICELPRDMLALEWGYEADHPFDAHGAHFAASGIPFYVCPGTSSWNALAGRTTNMRVNLVQAAASGLRHGACGYLITDWGDGGHWQPLAVSMAGFVYGAALAWNLARNQTVDVAAAMDRFGGMAGMGATLLRLGDVYQLCGAVRSNGSELFMMLSRLRTQALPTGITPTTLQAVLNEIDAIEQAMPTSSCSVVLQEVQQVIRLLRMACHRGQALVTGTLDVVATREALGAELDALLAAHEAVWLLRNRSGGLADSKAKMALVRQEYVV